MAGLALLSVTLALITAGGVKEGDPAPLAAMTGVVDAAGSPVNLSDLVLRPASVPAGGQKGKATLLVFWASWCRPCIHEIPVLNELRRVYARRGLGIFGLGVREGGETLDRLNGAAATNEASYPILYDGEGKAQEAFGVRVLPMSALIDAGGQVRWLGPALPSDVGARIEALLEPGERRGAE